MSIFIATDFGTTEDTKSNLTGVLSPVLESFLDLCSKVDRNQTLRFAGIDLKQHLVIEGQEDVKNQLLIQLSSNNFEATTVDANEFLHAKLVIVLDGNRKKSDIAAELTELGANVIDRGLDDILELTIRQEEKEGATFAMAKKFLSDVQIEGVTFIGPYYWRREEPDAEVTAPVATDQLLSLHAPLEAIKAKFVPDRFRSCRDVLIGVIDQGVDANHVELKDNLWCETFENLQIGGKKSASPNVPSIVIDRIDGKLSIDVYDRFGHQLIAYNQPEIQTASERKHVEQLLKLIEETESSEASPFQSRQQIDKAIGVALDIVGPVHGASFVEEAISADVSDARADNAHGTMVTGVIGASSVDDPEEPSFNDIRSPLGVCPECSIVTLKSTTGDLPTSILLGLNYAIKLGVNVINCSWSFEGNVVEACQGLRSGFAKALDAGVLVVVSAGDDGKDLDRDRDPSRFPVVPASYDFENIICVTGLSRELNGLSTVGLVKANYGDQSVDIAAPAHDILTMTSSASKKGSGKPTTPDGVSYATSLVTGGVTLIWSAINQLEKNGEFHGSEQHYNIVSTVPRWKLVKELLFLNTLTLHEFVNTFLVNGQPIQETQSSGLLWGEAPDAKKKAVLHLGFLQNHWQDWRWPRLPGSQTI